MAFDRNIEWLNSACIQPGGTLLSKVDLFRAYTRGGRGEAYIRVEKRVTNLEGLYSGELIHGGRGGLFTEFYGIYRTLNIIECFYSSLYLTKSSYKIDKHIQNIP